MNGVNAKHTNKSKNGKNITTIMWKGSPYVNAKDVEKFVNNQIRRRKQ